jgi:hypothetical protein
MGFAKGSTHPAVLDFSNARNREKGGAVATELDGPFGLASNMSRQKNGLRSVRADRQGTIRSAERAPALTTVNATGAIAA